MVDVTEKIQTKMKLLAANKKRKERLSFINKEMIRIEEALDRSNIILSKEQQDYEKLEKRSLKSLFTEFLGEREKMLEKERQEYLQAVLIHNGLIEERENLMIEKEIIKRNIIPNDQHLQKDIDNLVKYKSDQLKGDSTHKNMIILYESKMYAKKILIKDIKEAITEGNKLMKTLHSITTKLKKVKKWGAYKMHGKGKYSSYNKKTYIDKAHKDVILADIQIKKFDKEIRDIDPSIDRQFTLDAFEDFIGVFYDNLITDWLIQQKLSTAIHSVEQSVNKLERLLLMLDHEHKKNIKALDFVKSELKMYVIES